MLMCVGCVCYVSLQCTCDVCESQGFKLSCECSIPSLTPFLLLDCCWLQFQWIDLLANLWAPLDLLIAE